MLSTIPGTDQALNTCSLLSLPSEDTNPRNKKVKAKTKPQSSWRDRSPLTCPRALTLPFIYSLFNQYSLAPTHSRPDGAEYLKTNYVGAHSFRTCPQVGAELSHPLVSREEIRMGVNKEQLCFKEKALFAGSGVQSGHAMPTPIPANWLHFFRTSRAFSFLISFASSPISRQYSLNLSSESWFTSKLFIFSSKEPASWGDTTANSGVRNGCFDTGRQGRLAGHYSLPSKSTRTTPSTFWTKLQPQHGTAWCPSPGGSKGWKWGTWLQGVLWSKYTHRGDCEP